VDLDATVDVAVEQVFATDAPLGITQARWCVTLLTTAIDDMSGRNAGQ
jgi:hypothetical protein